MDAFDKWLSARKAFEHAALGFLDASTTLKDVVTRSEASIAKGDIVEIVLGQHELVAESFHLIRSRMQHSQRILNAFTNISAQRVPISKLPAEILSRIFSSFLASSSKHENDALLNIILVCTRWYQVATSTPALWNHVDLCTSPNPVYGESSSRFGRVKLFLTRSRGLPIHFHLPSNRRHFNRTDMVELGLMLQSQEATVGSIELHGRISYSDTDSARYSLTQSMLTLISTPGRSDSLRALTIAALRPSILEYSLIWPSTPLAQLGELTLEDLVGPACPSLAQVTIMLSKCPLLHTLRLRNLETNLDDSLSPIQLPNLRLLDISNVPGVVPLLSSQISPGANRLDVRLDLRSSEMRLNTGATQGLFLSNVFSLTVRQLQETVHMGSYLTSTPNLRVLILDMCHNPTCHVLDPMLEYVASLSANQPPPGLQALGFMSGAMDSELMAKLKKIVDAMRPRTLVFINVSFSALRDQDEELAEYRHFDRREAFSGYFPSEDEKWFRSRVDRIITYPIYPSQVYKGVDSFLEHLAGFE
ncbi:F-box-like protein [Ceratobasidium sp. AG-Ba]|nr:F-box-like protein [Ceratobasidium sp. AG-Ba]QRW03395.1 F-box-like protein [Ceratobasidium sp. AG-Ba]